MQAVQIVGALAILLAYALLQARRLRPEGYTYLSMNLAGALLLLVTAAAAEQWGFVMLNASWSAVSALGLMRRLSGRSHVRP